MIINKKILIIIGIFSLAFIIRIINLETMKDNPFFDYPIMDEKYHDEWAREIASGDLSGRTPFYRAPLYPYLLGLIYIIFGPNYYLAHLLGIIIGAVSCSVIFLLGRELFSDRVGILSGILASFYSMFLFFDSMLLTVSLEVLLSLLTIYLFVRWLRTRRREELLMSGLILGLASITRPNFLIILPVTVVYILVTLKDNKFKNRLIPAILFSTAVLIPVLSVTLINYTIGKDSVIIAWNGGINFFLGNNPKASGWSATAPGIDATWWGGYKDAILIAERSLGKTLLPSQVSNYWFSKGFQFVISKPFDWLILILKKIYLLLNSIELNNNVSIRSLATTSDLLRIPIFNFGLIISFGLFSIIFIRKKAAVKFATVFLYSYVITIILFFVTSRYRIPIIPILLIFFSMSVFTIIENIRKWKKDLLIKAAIFIPAMMVFVNTDFYNTNKFHKVDYSWLYGSYGNRFFEQSNYSKALHFYNKALKFNPKSTDAMNGIGNTYLAIGQTDLAIKSYRNSLEIKRNVDALSKIGVTFLVKGEMDSAKPYLTEAIKISPTSPEAHYYLGLYYAYNNTPKEAIAHMESAIKFYPDPRYLENIYTILTKLYLESGDTLNAKKYLLKIKRN